MDRRVILLSLGAVSFSCSDAIAGALSLEEIIRRHTDARGGAAALDAVRALAVDLEITEGGSTIKGRYLASIDRLARIDIMADGKAVYSEGLDGKGCWLWPRSEPAPRASTAEGAANALLHGLESNLVGLHRFPERGHKLVLTPPEMIDGVEHQVIQVTFSTGHVTYLFLDPRTWMITRKRDERAYHPDMDKTRKQVESRFSDFVAVQCVVAPHRNDDYNLATGELLSSNRVLRREINPKLPDGVFDRNYARV